MIWSEPCGSSSKLSTFCRLSRLCWLRGLKLWRCTNAGSESSSVRISSSFRGSGRFHCQAMTCSGSLATCLTSTRSCRQSTSRTTNSASSARICLTLWQGSGARTFARSSASTKAHAAQSGWKSSNRSCEPSANTNRPSATCSESKSRSKAKIKQKLPTKLRRDTPTEVGALLEKSFCRFKFFSSSAGHFSTRNKSSKQVNGKLANFPNIPARLTPCDWCGAATCCWRGSFARHLLVFVLACRAGGG
jgi:hypothetical protein